MSEERSISGDRSASPEKQLGPERIVSWAEDAAGLEERARLIRQRLLWSAAEIRALHADLAYLFDELPFTIQTRWGGDAREFREGLRFARKQIADGE